MTKNPRAKRAARAYAAEHNVSYREAKRALEQAGTGDGHSTVWPVPRTVEELADDAVGACAEWLGGADIDVTADGTGTGIRASLGLPEHIVGTIIDDLEIEQFSVEVEVVEEHSGGTLTCTVTATGVLTVTGQMPAANAYLAVEAGRVSLVEPQVAGQHAEVSAVRSVDLTFDAIINPEPQSTETMDLVGIAQNHPQVLPPRCYVCDERLDGGARSRIRLEGITAASSWVWGPVAVHDPCRLKLHTPFDEQLGNGYESTWDLVALPPDPAPAPIR